MDELPIYGNEPRVKVKNQRGAFQEIEIRAHSLDEIDTPEFWKFLAQSVRGFETFTQRVAENLEDLTPWKRLGRKWHFLRKGFTGGSKVRWRVEVLEELFDMLAEVAEGGQFLWSNKVLVHLIPANSGDVWATVVTKRAESIDLMLNGPKGAFALGRLTSLARDRSLDATRADRDVITLKFRTSEDLHKGDLRGFLEEHYLTSTGS